MKVARVAVLAIALGAGVVAALLALRLTGGNTPAPQVAATPTVETAQVLVAAVDIPTGTTLKGDSVKWQDWPKSGAGSSFMVRSRDAKAKDDVVGAIARSTFFAGEPITNNKLIRSDRGFMSAILPAGKRAIAIKIAADTSAGGFILPNDRVDVIMTRRERGANESVSGYQTETILNNVRVLAIDQTVKEGKDGETVVGQTATLELTPQQAEILTVAQQMSDRLTLALRSIADNKVDPDQTNADAYHLIGGTKNNGAVTVVRNGIAKEVSGLR